MKMKKRLITIVMVLAMVSISLTAIASDYVSVTLNGRTFTISYDEIRRLAEINNVDPVKLKEAYEMGVDEDGRFSPFSRVKTLDNGVTKEELEELNKLKMSSTGVPLTRPSTDSEDLESNMIQFDTSMSIDSPISSMETIEKKSLTSKEALSLAYKEVKKISEEESLLINLQSTDDTDKAQSISDGADGRRNAWNINFGNEKGSMLVYCSIRDGVCNIDYVRKDDKNLFQKCKHKISDLKIDSSEAIQRAIKTFNIQPGDPEIEDDWIKGYHFTIYETVVDERPLIFRVTGISPNSPNDNNESLRMNVFFNATTGEMLSATEQIGYDKDGRSMWREIEVNEQVFKFP